MSRRNLPKGLMVLALTIGVMLVGWAVLLSPPFEGIREFLGIQMPPYGRQIVLDSGEKAAEICNTDPKACKQYLGRITLLYHGVFALLVAMTVYPAVTFFGFSRDYRKPVLALTALGSIFTVAGGVLYGYLVEDPVLHGVFIVGLTLLFAAGVLFLFGFSTRKNGGVDLLALNLLLASALLVLTSIIGGWMGANEMVGLGEVLREAKISARVDPDLTQEILVWRAMTAHQHGMVAILGAAISFLIYGYLGIDTENRIVKGSLVLALVGQLIMVTASWGVWPFGRVAHLAITPAAVVLIIATGLISAIEIKRRAESDGLKALFTKSINAFSSHLLIIWVWPTVAIPGAIVAMSLRRPLLLRPEFRDPLWDWAENAYNIGHWHILIFIYGAALFILYVDMFGRGKVGAAVVGLVSLSSLVASLAINFYIIPSDPGPYSPNPYANEVLGFFVEPALGLFSVAVAVGYFYILYQYLTT